MKQKLLWQVTIFTSLEAEDAVVELMTGVFGRPAAVYSNEKTKVSKASVYCSKRSEWTPAKRAALMKGLGRIRAAGLNIGAGKIQFKKVPREDWSEAWKRHFKPIAFGRRLLVKPSWIKTRPVPGQAVVVLDPGLSFGTGNHATTEFCLARIAAEKMERRIHAASTTPFSKRERDSGANSKAAVKRPEGRVPGAPKSFLDIGTGSGILAIAAVKLGFAPVRAVDFDRDCIRVAKENAQQNGVSKRVEIALEDITKAPAKSREKYDFICANLISTLLIQERRRILNRLSENGKLVVAGILREEFSLVQTAFEELGMELVKCGVKREWRSGMFVRRNVTGK